MAGIAFAFALHKEGLCVTEWPKVGTVSKPGLLSAAISIGLLVSSLIRALTTAVAGWSSIVDLVTPGSFGEYRVWMSKTVTVYPQHLFAQARGVRHEEGPDPGHRQCPV